MRIENAMNSIRAGSGARGGLPARRAGRASIWDWDCMLGGMSRIVELLESRRLFSATPLDLTSAPPASQSSTAALVDMHVAKTQMLRSTISDATTLVSGPARDATAKLSRGAIDPRGGAGVFRSSDLSPRDGDWIQRTPSAGDAEADALPVRADLLSEEPDLKQTATGTVDLAGSDLLFNTVSTIAPLPPLNSLLADLMQVERPSPALATLVPVPLAAIPIGPTPLEPVVSTPVLPSPASSSANRATVLTERPAVDREPAVTGISANAAIVRATPSALSPAATSNVPPLAFRVDLAVSLALTVGFVAQLLVPASWLSAFLASFPAWRWFDPVPVLNSRRARRVRSRLLYPRPLDLPPANLASLLK